VKRARGTQEGVSSVMMLDLDRFRMINETYGHLAGDGVIKEIPERLEGLFSASDTMARLAGDQFGFLVENYKTKRDVLVKATEVIKAVGRAFELNGDDVHLACDIGVVFNLGDYEKSEDVIRDAEVALQQSKAERDKTRIKVFSKGMHEEVAEALSVENEMRKAVREDQFQVYYQPIISLENEQVVGFEALMRWFHPGLGEITPVRFIPVAEHTGLILKMGADILKTACLQLVEWQEELAGFPDLVMSVNVSPKQLGDRTVNEMLDRVLSETRVDPQNLKLEITESLIMHDTRAAMKFFENLRSRGVRLAIDDFGTGYSSLGYLHRFPVDYLKIAKSFVSGESAADENRTIIKSIVNLAENLGFKVIAEGAETREQVDMLKELGCHEVQGFYFARPMEPHEALAFLREQATGRT
jgi:Amt family ammonium transporter